MSVSRGHYLVFLICLSLIVGACQTTDGIDDLNIFSGKYNLFRSPADHIEDLLADNKILAASDIYNEQLQFFKNNPNDSDVKEAEAHLAKAVELEFKPDVDKTLSDLERINWPEPVSSWDKIRNSLNSAEKIVTTIKEHKILDSRKRPFDEIAVLETKLDTLKETIKKDAVPQINQFSFSKGTDFFSSYPITIDISRFYQEHRELVHRKIAQADRASLRSFYKTNFDLPSSLTAGIAQNFYNKSLEENGYPKSGAFGVFRTLEDLKSAGLNKHFNGPDKAHIGIFRVAANDQDQYFPVELAQLDNGLQISSWKINSSPWKTGLAKYPYLLFLDTRYAVANRKVEKSEKIASFYQSSSKTLPNPNYLSAQAKVREMEMKYQSAIMNDATTRIQSSTPCYGSGCLGQALGQIGAAVGKAIAQENLQNAVAALQSIPPTIEEPVYTPYSFVRSHLLAQKQIQLHYYLFDSQLKRLTSGIIPFVETQKFIVNYNFKDSDRDRYEHESDTNTEDDVEEYLAKPIKIDPNKVINHIILSNLRQAHVASLSAVIKKIRLESNQDRKALRVIASKSRSYVKRDPVLFQSVVQIKTATTAGSGFYVTPKIVITNAHVVDEHKFADIARSDKSEIFGKIIARDLRRDLALIRVNEAGKPVIIYSGTLAVGNEVMAIGHPFGLEFSAARGIVSAVRPLPSLPGAPPVLFVQTDAAINKGNSGGPLFLNGKVIGVNTQGLKKDKFEGLSFAVHFSEVVEFLREKGIAKVSG